MILAADAIYENGVLKLDKPLALSENQRVRVIIHTEPSRVSQSYGLLKWTGSVEDLEYLAESPENSSWAHHDDDF